MDDPKVPTEADPFVPLRLTLYPGGSSVNLTRPDMLIGRHSEADLRLHLPDVSRRHCRFIFRDGGWHVYDLHSMNGLFVNEERVEQAALHDGDLVRIGSYTFEVHLLRTEPASVPLHANTMRTLEGIAGALAPPEEQPRRQAS